MVRAHEHGHERSRTRPRLDHTPIKAMPVGPPPGLNVPNFNRVATLRRFVIVARGARCGPHLSSVAARTAVRDSSGVRLCTCGIGAGRRCAGSTAVAGCRPSFSGDLPPPAASERGKQPQNARPRGPSHRCRSGTGNSGGHGRPPRSHQGAPIRRYVGGHLRREKVGNRDAFSRSRTAYGALWSGPGDNPINAAVRQRLRPR